MTSSKIFAPLGRFLAFFIILSVLMTLIPSQALAEHAGFALEFDGVDDYVTLGDTGDLFGGDGWASTKTISLWIKPTGTNPPATAPASGELIAGNDRPRLFGITRAAYNGQDRLWIWNADNNGLDSIGIEFTPGEWTHIAMVHTAGNLSAYKNGVLVGMIASGDTFVPNGTNDGALFLGGTGRNNPALYFQGQLDEVQFWTVPLDQNLFQAWLYSELNSGHPEWSHLAAYYQMSAGAGTTLPDDSPNNHPGALLGGMSDGNWVASGALEPPGTPVPTATPTATSLLPTATPLPPTATSLPPTATSLPPTATPLPPTATSLPPTATSLPPTATSLPPTATSLPPTATSLPPTATSLPPTATSLPPTATSLPPTATPLPPTATPLPPTATPLPPTATPLPPTPTPTPGGSVNYALEFDGANDFVELSNTTDMMGYGWPNTKTISFWVKPAEQAQTCTVPSVAWCDAIFGDRPRWWGVSQGILNGQDRIWVWNYDGSPGSSYDLLGIEYTAGEWTHIALVHSGGILTAYKNGLEVSSTPSGPTLQPPGYPVLHLGGIINNPSRVWTFAGQLDEVRIWNIARTPAEILLEMNQPLVGNEPGLAAYYQMSNGAGVTLTDDSVNTWDGTLYDGARNVPPDGHLPGWVISGAY